MKTKLIFALLLSIGSQAIGQQLEDFEINAKAWGDGKMRKEDKRIYISKFEINYQLMANFSETAEGGRQLGGSYRGDATASLVLGIPGIDEKKLQENTNQLYQQFVAQLKSEGFTIITPDEASKTKLYADWERLSGGTPSMGQNPGYIQTVPAGFDYFKEKINKKGRAKTSIFYGIQLTKLAKEMDGAFIAIVKVNVPVFEDAESGGSKMLGDALGGVAKVVVRANYRLAPSIYFQTGAMSGEAVLTQVTIMHPEGAINCYLKKDASITGVFDNSKKYKAVETAAVDSQGTQMGALTIFRPDDRTLKQMQTVTCDPDKFIEGARVAGEAFILGGLKEFLAVINK